MLQGLTPLKPDDLTAELERVLLPRLVELRYLQRRSYTTPRPAATNSLHALTPALPGAAGRRSRPPGSRHSLSPPCSPHPRGCACRSPRPGSCPRDERAQAGRGLDVHGKGPQIAVVDAQDRGARLERALDLRLVVDLHERGHAQARRQGRRRRRSLSPSTPTISRIASAPAMRAS